MAVTGLTCGVLTTLALGAQGAAPARVYSKATPGIVLPTAVRQEQPRYTAAALREQIAGSALVDVTVDVDGTVRDVLLVASVDPVHGLDDQALATAGRWVFTPGTLHGRPVPVRVQVAMSFARR
jgi:TonB family protein